MKVKQLIKFCKQHDCKHIDFNSGNARSVMINNKNKKLYLTHRTIYLASTKAVYDSISRNIFNMILNYPNYELFKYYKKEIPYISKINNIYYLEEFKICIISTHES